MPSTSTRRLGSATRTPPAPRPRRPLGRGFTVPPPAPVRPLVAPFAAAFGLLVAVEDGYLDRLLEQVDPGWGWYLLAPALLAVLALTGAVLVLRGAALGRLLSGSAVLALACVLPLLGLLGLAGTFAVLGDGAAVWWTLPLLAGPLGGLALGLQRPVQDWTRRRPVSSRGRRRRSG